jgi:hypothetical protein
MVEDYQAIIELDVIVVLSLTRSNATRYYILPKMWNAEPVCWFRQPKALTHTGGRAEHLLVVLGNPITIMGKDPIWKE